MNGSLQMALFINVFRIAVVDIDVRLSKHLRNLVERERNRLAHLLHGHFGAVSGIGGISRRTGRDHQDRGKRRAERGKGLLLHFSSFVKGLLMHCFFGFGNA